MSGRPQIIGVVFDVDGTLVDHDRAQYEGLRGFLEHAGEPLTDDRWTHWRDLEEHNFARYLAGELSFAEHHRNRARAFTEQAMSDDEANAWFQSYLVHFQDSWSLFDDVLATLDALDKSNVALAAFSNVSGDFTRLKLRTVGIAHRFRIVWGNDDVQASKPDVRVFDRLRDELAIPVEQLLHVGDRYEADARGPVDAGWHAVWLDRPDADPRGRQPQGRPDELVNRVASLDELVQRLSIGSFATR